MKRIGHKGAHLIAPGNTVASFDAAIGAGVDMIEFDVLRCGGRLLLAHDPQDARRADAITLQEGLDHLLGLDVDLNVDLKWTGYEEEVLGALRERGLLGRALISTMETASLGRLRALEPAARIARSVPRLRRDPRDRHAVVRYPTYAVLGAWRAALPRLVGRAIRARRYDALMSHFALVTPRLVRAVHAAGGEIYAWTVDDADGIRALERLGVDGVITNDPRLFS